MKKIFLFLFTSLIISCSNSNDDTVEDVLDSLENISNDNSSSNSSTPQTFLEKYNGTGYRLDDEYIYLYNDETFIKIQNEEDQEFGFYCYLMSEGDYTSDDFFGALGTLSIVTNDENSLLIEFISSEGSEYNSNWQFTMDDTGNNLTIRYDGDPDNDDIYTKTTREYDQSVCGETLDKSGLVD